MICVGTVAGNIPALEATSEVSRQRMKEFAHDLKWNTVTNRNADTDVKGVEQGCSAEPSLLREQPKQCDRHGERNDRMA